MTTDNLFDLQSLPCLGALVGDTVGSVYEFDNIKTTEFPLFDFQSSFTDDSVMTIAVADWIANTDQSQESLECKLVEWGNKYPHPMGSYGAAFSRWLFYPEFLRNMQTGKWGGRQPYGSFGNGSAMRASACGWVAKTMEEALDLGRRSAEITHNHIEGIKGAQATSAAIYLARTGAGKEDIRTYIENAFAGYNLHRSCDEIRESYKWDASCQGTVPPAIIAFLDSCDFESAVRLAVSLGGDSDTLACITGSIAQAYYKHIPDQILQEMQRRIPEDFWLVLRQLAAKVQ